MPLYPRNKKSRPFGRREPSYDPLTGRFQVVGDTRELAEFVVVEAGHDVIVCTDRDERKVLVAKASPLRLTVFDGETINGVTYAMTDVDERKATDSDGIVTNETVFPAYVEGETILAAKMPYGVEAHVIDGEFTQEGDVRTGDYLVTLEDVNSAARRWESPRTARALLVTNRADGNLLDAKILDPDGVAAIDSIVVARPDDLRAEFYVGTWNGVAYTQNDKDSRDAVAGAVTETQKVTPDYVEGKSILLIERIGIGVGILDPATSLPVYWIDNTPGRAWAIG